MKHLDKALAAVAFAVTVAYVPGIPGYAIAPRWAVLAACLPLILLFVSQVRMTPGHWLGALVLGYAAVSLFWSPILVEGLQGLAFLSILGVAFILGAEASSLRPALHGMMAGVSINAIIAAFQWFDLSPVEQIVSPAGLFANKNMLGEIGALAVVAAFTMRTWVWMPGAMTALLLANCRGAIAGVVAAGLVWVWTRSRLAGIAGVILLLLSFHVMFVGSELYRNTLIVRGQVAMDAVENLKWFGHGVGQYWVVTPQNAPRQEVLNVRHWHAHNDMLEMVFNFGLGAVPFLLLLGLCLFGPYETERLILVAFLVSGLFGFPLNMAATGFIGALVAGRLARGWADLRRPMDDGPIHRGFGYAKAWALSAPYRRAAGRGETLSPG